MLPQIASSLASDSSTNNQTVHTVNLPATIYTNDLILCIIAANNGTPSVTELSGFTVVNTASEAFVFAKISDDTKRGQFGSCLLSKISNNKIIDR